MGLCFLTVSAYIIYQAVVAANPKRESDNGTIHKKYLWRRNLVLFHTLWFVLFEFLLLSPRLEPSPLPYV